MPPLSDRNPVPPIPPPSGWMPVPPIPPAPAVWPTGAQPASQDRATAASAARHAGKHVGAVTGGVGPALVAGEAGAGFAVDGDKGVAAGVAGEFLDRGNRLRRQPVIEHRAFEVGRARAGQVRGRARDMVVEVAAEEIGELVEPLAGDEGGGVEVDTVIVVDPDQPQPQPIVEQRPRPNVGADRFDQAVEGRARRGTPRQGQRLAVAVQIAGITAPQADRLGSDAGLRRHRGVRRPIAATQAFHVLAVDPGHDADPAVGGLTAACAQIGLGSHDKDGLEPRRQRRIGDPVLDQQPHKRRQHLLDGRDQGRGRGRLVHRRVFILVFRAPAALPTGRQLNPAGQRPVGFFLTWEIITHIVAFG
jgi:hypothetical protein